jgi:hypothetical protein
MRDLHSILLLYSLRVAFTSLEHVTNSGDDDYYDLKTILKKHVLRLESQLHWSNDDGWMRPDSASSPKSASFPSFANRDCGFTDYEGRGRLSASSLISIARATLRTLERSSELPVDSPALQKLREAVAEIVAELEPAAKKEPKFELRTGPDLYSRKTG